MEEIIEAWLDTYRAAGKSAGTIRARQSYVRTAARTVPLLALTPDELQAYLASRSQLSPEARKSMVIGLRSFYRWAFRRGLLLRDEAGEQYDLAAELPPITVPRALPHPISEVDLARARAVADKSTRLMIDLAALAGLRRAEIARVHSDHLTDLGLVVLGKGRVERLVPLHPLLAEPLGKVRGWAFPSPRRTGRPVTPDYIATRMEEVLPEPWTCHSLRHYFGTKAYKGSRDLRAVQELLGHKSPETTQRYVLTDVDALVAAVRSIA